MYEKNQTRKFWISTEDWIDVVFEIHWTTTFSFTGYFLHLRPHHACNTKPSKAFIFYRGKKNQLIWMIFSWTKTISMEEKWNSWAYSKIYVYLFMSFDKKNPFKSSFFPKLIVYTHAHKHNCNFDDYYNFDNCHCIYEFALKLGFHL